MSELKINRVKRTKTIYLSRPLELVFPMFQPEGEKSWTASWNPRYVWPHDGQPREGLVFTHDSGEGTESIWTMTRFDPYSHRIEYTVVAPDSHVTQIRIRCKELQSARTSATICYTVTAISEQGLEVLDKFTPAEYEHRIHTWQLAIDHFFDTGHASEVH